MHIVDSSVDDRRMPPEIGREAGVGGQRVSNCTRRFQVATQQMQQRKPSGTACAVDTNHSLGPNLGKN